MFFELNGEENRMVNKNLNQQQLEALCGVLGHTNDGFTKKELSSLLIKSNIVLVDDGSFNNGYVYKTGLNKKEWLYNCLVNEINMSHSMEKVYAFLEIALDPVSFTDDSKREKYRCILEKTNKVLLLVGLTVTPEGKLQEVVAAKTLDEVDRRVNSLQKQLYNRAIHREVQKYCIADYLRKDYYDAVFEAAKGLAERVRDITGLKTDGGKLFDTAFSTNDPYLFFNSMQTDSERSEFIGLKELLASIFHLVRNKAAHTPKINWKIEEAKALDVLTRISVAHKYLDECPQMPNT